MGIQIVRYRKNKVVSWGVIKEETIISLSNKSETLSDFLVDGITEAKELLVNQQAERLSLNEVDLLSPVTNPSNIICQGVNYSMHRKETGMSSSRAPYNMIFSKVPSSICGPSDAIIKPNHVQLLDYEIELGLVIGKEINEQTVITDDNISEYIAGLVIANDVSARDVQLTELQWLKGKSYRTFCPVGPYLVVLDQNEFDSIYDLELLLTVNGEVRQSANTNQLLYKPVETLNELAQTINLTPGDLVLTGTPGGVAMQLSPEEMNCMTSLSASFEEKQRVIQRQFEISNYLNVGDVIEATISSPKGNIQLGKQRNVVKEIQYISN